MFFVFFLDIYLKITSLYSLKIMVKVMKNHTYSIHIQCDGKK